MLQFLSGFAKKAIFWDWEIVRVEEIVENGHDVIMSVLGTKTLLIM